MIPNPATEQAPPAARRWWRVHLLAWLAAAGLVGGVTGAVAWRLESQRTAQQVRNDFLKAEIAGLEAQTKEIAELRSQIDMRRAEQEVGALWKKQRQWPARVLRLLAEARPEGLHFDQVQDTDEGLRLAGRARSFGEVAELTATLGRSPLLSRIDVAALEREDGAPFLRFALDAAVGKAWRPLERPTGRTRAGAAVGDPK